MIDLTKEEPITVSEICSKFDVCSRTVTDWFKRGLRSAKLGKKTISSLQALNEFLQEPGNGTSVKSNLPSIRERNARAMAALEA